MAAEIANGCDSHDHHLTRFGVGRFLPEQIDRASKASEIDSLLADPRASQFQSVTVLTEKYAFKYPYHLLEVFFIKRR